MIIQLELLMLSSWTTNKGKIESKKSFISELSVVYVYKTLTVIWKHEYEAKDVQSIVIQIQSLSNRRIV